MCLKSLHKSDTGAQSVIDLGHWVLCFACSLWSDTFGRNKSWSAQSTCEYAIRKKRDIFNHQIVCWCSIRQRDLVVHLYRSCAEFVILDERIYARHGTAHTFMTYAHMFTQILFEPIIHRLSWSWWVEPSPILSNAPEFPIEFLRPGALALQDPGRTRWSSRAPEPSPWGKLMIISVCAAPPDPEARIFCSLLITTKGLCVHNCDRAL